jgi:hypothetical protein
MKNLGIQIQDKTSRIRNTVNSITSKQCNNVFIDKLTKDGAPAEKYVFSGLWIWIQKLRDPDREARKRRKVKKCTGTLVIFVLTFIFKTIRIRRNYRYL